MKWVSVVLAVLAFVTGLLAAYYWYRSSKVPNKPTWNIEPGDERFSQEGWITGTMMAFDASSRLNTKAAIWTAFSVVLGAASSIVGSVAVL